MICHTFWIRVLRKNYNAKIYLRIIRGKNQTYCYAKAIRRSSNARARVIKQVRQK